MTPMVKRHRVRVSEAGFLLLRDLAERTGDPASAVLERAIAQYWREQLFEEAGRQWAAIQADPHARAALEAEYAAWDSLSADGFERESW